MTDYELYSLFVQQFETGEILTERFLTLLFGFLIASYLVSAKLDRLMTTIVLSLYSVMAIRYAVVFLNTSGDVVAMAAELRALAANPDSSLTWLEIGPIDIFLQAAFAAMLLSYAASVVFFFRSRSSESRKRQRAT